MVDAAKPLRAIRSEEARRELHLPQAPGIQCTDQSLYAHRDELHFNHRLRFHALMRRNPMPKFSTAARTERTKYFVLCELPLSAAMLPGSQRASCHVFGQASRLNGGIPFSHGKADASSPSSSSRAPSLMTEDSDSAPPAGRSEASCASAVPRGAWQSLGGRHGSDGGRRSGLPHTQTIEAA